MFSLSPGLDLLKSSSLIDEIHPNRLDVPQVSSRISIFIIHWWIYVIIWYILLCGFIVLIRCVGIYSMNTSLSLNERPSFEFLLRCAYCNFVNFFFHSKKTSSLHDVILRIYIYILILMKMFFLFIFFLLIYIYIKIKDLIYSFKWM